MFPAAWPVMLAIGALQALFAVGSAIDAFVDGDYRGAGELLVTAALMLGARFPGCRFGRIAALGLRAMGVVHAGFSVYNAIGQFQNGDPVGGLLSLGQAGADIFVATRACFTGEMLLDVEDGKKRADTIMVGDHLWSRNEFDPTGPCELREVEEVFVRVAPILNVHVAGQIIRTTAEHPFWVSGRGWKAACALQIGDLVSTRGGLLVPVEGVADSGAVETVYNWRIAEHHTYFVSGSVGGASIWAHNANYTNGSTNRRRVARGGVYVLRDAEENVVRTGRTNDLGRRSAEHGRTYPDLEFDPIHRTNNPTARRGLEQMLHEQYLPELDAIGGISPTNPNRAIYMRAARQFLQNLRRLGS